MKQEQEFLTGEELADMLKVSLKFIKKHSHRIPGKVKVGSLVRYEKTAVTKALCGGKLLMSK